MVVERGLFEDVPLHELEQHDRLTQIQLHTTSWCDTKPGTRDALMFL